jgi:hypothetical protein
MDPQHWTVANHEFNTLRIRLQHLPQQGGRLASVSRGNQINADPSDLDPDPDPSQALSLNYS